MSQVVAFNLAGKVLELLSPLIREEIKLACCVKADLENLKSTVSTIKDVLLDAEKKADASVAVKGWLEKLKDVLHDADDVLDDFSTEALQRNVMAGNKMSKEVRIFFSSSNQLAFSLKMGHKIKAIRERLDVINKEKEDFHFNVGSNEPQVMNRDRESRDTNSLVREDEVIGRKKDKKEIKKRLFDNNVVDDISIVAIVGIGGLGKTTLAQLVYNDENVKFDLKLWICISDNLDIKRIVKEVLEQMKEWNHEESIEAMQQKLREKLKGNKCLIVLDDLWNEDYDEWLRLMNLFRGAKMGSRIIVTTRLESVARIIRATSCYFLGVLPKEKAWSLFVKMAFERGQESKYEALVAIGQKIVEYCDGLPLAIRTIGSLLYGKTSKIEWQSFLDYELSKLTQQENKISSTLKLSYDHLPPHLKQCFAYCRLFPKGHRINVHTLINLWAAQGFIVLVNRKQRFEDVGREYFMKLLWRSFFQDVENDKLGNIESCKMHDLMYDLAGLVSGSESAILNSSEENVIEKVRHVSFDLVDSSRQFSILIPTKRKIRTTLIASVGRTLGNLTRDALISNFNYLRTLDLSELEIHVVPHSIEELKHLRYLDLSENKNIEFLPNSITKLLNLLTVKLNNCSFLKELPRGLKNLVNLRHLDISGCSKLTHMPLGLGHLTSLEILTGFVVRQEDLKASSCNWHKKKQGRSGGGLSELKELSNLGGILDIRYLGHGEDDTVECKATNMKDKQHLQHLRLSCGWYKKKQGRSGGGLSELKELSNLGGSLFIQNLGHGDDDTVECKATNMKDKQHLQQLILSWVRDDKRDDGETECYDEMSLEGLHPHPNLKSLELWYYMGVRIPSWVSSLTNLVNFQLGWNRRLQHLPPLNQLPFLKSLILRGMKALEYISDEDSVSNVLGASSSSSSSSSKTPFFPSLSSLIIRFCPKLKGWWRNSDDDDDDNEPHHLLLPSFPPSLSKLQISRCPNLTSMPLIPYLTVSHIEDCPLLRLHEANREDCPK